MLREEFTNQGILALGPQKMDVHKVYVIQSKLFCDWDCKHDTCRDRKASRCEPEHTINIFTALSSILYSKTNGLSYFRSEMISN